MTNKQQELLSAFVDGELNKEELDQLLLLMEQNKQIRSDLQNYQFISDVMRGHARQANPTDFSERLTRALDDEPAHRLDATVNKVKAKVISLPTWFWKQTAGLAAAASVGALVVLNVMNQPEATQTAPAATQIASSAIDRPVMMQQPLMAEQTSTVAVAPPSNPNRWTVGEQEVEDRLQNYLVDHNEYAGASGLFSYARVVSYGEE